MGQIFLFASYKNFGDKFSLVPEGLSTCIAYNVEPFCCLLYL